MLLFWYGGNLGLLWYVGQLWQFVFQILDITEIRVEKKKQIIASILTQSS